MSGLQISVLTSNELQVAIGYLTRVDKEVSLQIRRHVKSFSDPEWSAAVSRGVRTPLQRAVLGNTTKVSVLNTNVNLRDANSTRALRGGASPADLAKAVEFGADRNRVTTYNSRSRKGKSYKVTRHTTRQLSSVSRTGWAAYPGAKFIIPRIASLYVQTTIRTLYETVDKIGG